MDITKQFEDRDAFLHWFLIASLAGVKVEGLVTEVPRKLTMQLNGAELNPEAAIKRLEEQFDRLVAEKAQELFEELKRDILKPFEDKVKEMTDAVSSLVEDKVDMEKICKKHIEKPAIMYGQCIGCELDGLRAEVKHWKANHADLKKRLAFATQRPDLPVDRIPAYEELLRYKMALEKISKAGTSEYAWSSLQQMARESLR